MGSDSQVNARKRRRDETAHVIVCGNEKGGSGKSTLAMHMAVTLLKSGYQVATIDLDGRQKSFTRYVENRRRWSAAHAGKLPVPHHLVIEPSTAREVAQAEDDESGRLLSGLGDLGELFDYVVIDTPGSDTFLNRLAHRIADTLVTPMNDSFVDLDVLARIDPATGEILGLSQYAEAVRDARRERRRLDGRVLDWIVVRNRLGSLSSRNERNVSACLRRLSVQLGFRVADGISERVIFRELFLIGATAADELEPESIGVRPTLSHLSARQEIRHLIGALNLPTDELGRRRAELRRRYAEAQRAPLVLPDIFAV